ncbi:von Willebrand factor type C domain protein [Dictyocaulus viviparus]|uniref:von Willebrand factor type C domain protein n=1 Tax=Dictyocaulus viviparus TaxID=29172 RepID=A0A0D8YBQ2_DICVI|nr:von Willebrand factor type C domain protein [Dictyocaulus viviparus]
MFPERCLKAQCSVVFHPQCPADSRQVLLPPPHGECCGRPGTCQCDLQKCDAFVPICEKGMERVLVKEGSHQPGSCCDVIERSRFVCMCRRNVIVELRCESVRCPSQVFDEDEGVECPADSVRPAEHVPHGLCCPVRPGCRCRAAVCRPAVCDEGKQLRIIRRGTGTPGRCCDEWTCEDDLQPMSQLCIRDGKTYSDGQQWHTSSCEVCRCRKGVAVCSRMTCPKTPEGECCPICAGCKTEKLEKKMKNETWQKDDCTTCTCSEFGTPKCVKHMCRTECENPRKVEGQCCPVCDEPLLLTMPAACPSIEHCPLRCEAGLRRDERGCFQCECIPSIRPNRCPELSTLNCDKQCAHGYMKDVSDCVVCKCAKCPPLHQCMKHCLYGYETNSIGCPVCKCRAISRIEAKLTIPEKIGRLAGWEKCVSLTSSSGSVVERDSGEWWSDGCRHCFCEQRQEFCSLISCAPRPKDCAEENWIHQDGNCCPSCATLSQNSLVASKHEHTVCQSPGSGRIFTDGETWQLAPCVSCTCRIGHVLCRAVDCPPIACHHPVMTSDDQCCPRCANNTVPIDSSTFCTDNYGTAHLAGASWRPDDCTSCECNTDASVICYRQQCDLNTTCQGKPLTIKGQCCPICEDALSSAVCSLDSSVYTVGEEWRQDICTNCSCHPGGHTVCRQLVCPQCVEPVPIEGHCCPLCKDKGWMAFSEGTGQSFNPAKPYTNTLLWIGLCLVSLAIVGFIIVLLILYKRSRGEKKKTFESTSSCVRLSASKHIGSIPHLVEWAPSSRKDFHGDGQSESLLSTVSDTMTATSCASSGADPNTDARLLSARTQHHFQCRV